ncbi:MAG: tetratricopeptide repeat protein [Planctomycetota bacterium]
MRKSTRLVLASGIAILGLTLTGCGGHGRYTQEQTNAAKEKLAQLKAGLEWQTAMGDFLAGDFPKALRAVDNSLILNDKVAKSHVLRGRILMEMGSLEGSLISLARAEELDAKNVEAQYFLGVVNERLERKEIALERFQQAADLDKTNPQYTVASAEVLVDLGRLDEAKSYLKGRGPEQEHNSAVRQTLGHIALMQGNALEAVSLFNEARLLSPNDTGVLEDLARAQIAAGQFSDANSNIERLLKDPTLTKRRDLMHLHAKCLAEIDRLADAREVLLKLSNDQSGVTDTDVWNDLGQVAYRLNDLNRVKLASSKLIAMAPRQPEGYILKGLYEHKRGDQRAAKDSVTKALSLKPTTSSMTLLAMIQLELHEYEGAKKTLAAVMQVEPGNLTARQMIDQMNAAGTATTTVSVDPATK